METGAIYLKKKTTNKHLSDMHRHRRILTDTREFIQHWNLKGISLTEVIKLPTIADQYMFDDGSLLCSACTKYSEHSFNNDEILWENSNLTEIENKMKSNLHDDRPVRMYLQTPLGQWYTTEIECSDFRCTKDLHGKDRWYFVLTRLGTKKKNRLENPLGFNNLGFNNLSYTNFDNEIW